MDQEIEESPLEHFRGLAQENRRLCERIAVLESERFLISEKIIEYANKTDEIFNKLAKLAKGVRD